MNEELVPLKDIFAILGQKEFELQLLRAKYAELEKRLAEVQLQLKEHHG